LRVRLSLLGAGLAALLAGCDQAAAHGPEQVPVATSAPRPRPTIPAADAGGACLLLDYDAIARTLGVRFDVAASARQSRTYTCVARSSEADLPDLVLTVSPTTADAAVFREAMAPDGAAAVKGLGRAGYRGAVEATRGQGPAAEVGWLSGDKRLLTLRLELPPGTPTATARSHLGGLTTLARGIDAARA
jgi:hypothetical protein